MFKAIEEKINQELTNFKSPTKATPAVLDDKALASSIDHTALAPDVSAAAIKTLCDQAKEHSFYSVCVPGSYIEQALAELNHTSVQVCSVVGFPLGYNDLAIKLAEVKLLANKGATELDIVQPIYLTKQRAWDKVYTEFKILRAAVNCGLKIILECALLDEFEIAMLTQLAIETGIDFVKTSTGFAKGGATLKDIALMKHFAQDRIKIKASGGIGTKEFALKLIKLGANRLGTSKSLAIVN